MSEQDFKPGDKVWVVEWDDNRPEVIGRIVDSVFRRSLRYTTSYGGWSSMDARFVHRTERAAWDEVIAEAESDLEYYREKRDRASS